MRPVILLPARHITARHIPHSRVASCHVCDHPLMTLNPVIDRVAPARMANIANIVIVFIDEYENLLVISFLEEKTEKGLYVRRAGNHKVTRMPRANLLQPPKLRLPHSCGSPVLCLMGCACHSWICACRQSISGRYNLCRDNSAGVVLYILRRYGGSLPFR